MIFALREYRLAAPAPTLSGPVRWRPMVPLGVARPAGGNRKFESAHVDTGADDVLLPVLWATDLGLPLSGAPAGRVRAASGQPFAVRYAEVELTVYAALDHYVRWRAVVGFAPVSEPLFGVAGGLQYFHLAFDYPSGHFLLSPGVGLPVVECRFPDRAGIPPRRM